jgi:hypothetical protein
LFSDLAIISAAPLGEVKFGQSTTSCLNVEQPENINKKGKIKRFIIINYPYI